MKLSPILGQVTSKINEPLFCDESAQAFFEKRCKVASPLIPEFTPVRGIRDLGKTQGIVQESNRGEKYLILPSDLHLREMVEIIRAIDSDTYKRRPELADKSAQQLIALGATFEQVGLYLQEYANYLQEHDPIAPIASKFAHAFWNYGRAIQSGKKSDDPLPIDCSLTEDNKQKLDERLLGSIAYEKRMNRLGDSASHELIAKRRNEILSTFFVALTEEGRIMDGVHPRESKAGPICTIQDTISKKIANSLDAPNGMLYASVLANGKEKLITEMRVSEKKNKITDIKNILRKFYISVPAKGDLLYDTLGIIEKKQRLQTLRQQRDARAIANEERAVANELLHAISTYPYVSVHDMGEAVLSPASMIETQFMNCVGANLVGTSLLDELGMTYLTANMDHHIFTILLTAEFKTYRLDFTPPSTQFVEIDLLSLADLREFPTTGHMNIGGQKRVVTIYKNSDGLLSTMANSMIIALYKQLNTSLGNTYFEGSEGLTISTLEYGTQILNTLSLGMNQGLKAFVLEKKGEYEQAVRTYQETIRTSPHLPYAYINLGELLINMGKYEDAEKTFQYCLQNRPGYPWLPKRVARGIEKCNTLATQQISQLSV